MSQVRKVDQKSMIVRFGGEGTLEASEVQFVSFGGGRRRLSGVFNLTNGGRSTLVMVLPEGAAADKIYQVSHSESDVQLSLTNSAGTVLSYSQGTVNLSNYDAQALIIKGTIHNVPGVGELLGISEGDFEFYP